MKTLYFVFEQIPNPNSGGLITMYKRMEYLLKNDYDMKIISIFDCPQEYKEQFQSECIVLNKSNIDNRFFKAATYLRNKNIKAFFHCITSAFLFFFYIPIARNKMNKILKSEDKIIVSSPAAGMFMTNKRPFILEIHSKYEFFWEESFSSKMQIKLMAKPTLTLFRNKTDANKAKNYFLSDYVYNFFDNKDIFINNDYKTKKKKFLFMGRFNQDKDPIRLLSIVKDVISDGTDINLDLYGQGPMEDDIKDFIMSNHLENNIKIKGFISNKNIYANYSALLLTSKREGFPLTVIEAKANGVPTISTIWGDAVKETITNGVDGFIAKDDNEFKHMIEKIVLDETLLKTFSENAYKDFDRFSIEEARKRYIKFIESV